MSNKKKVAEKMERKESHKFGKILAKSLSQHKDPEQAEAHAERTMSANKERETTMRKAKSLSGKLETALKARSKQSREVQKKMGATGKWPTTKDGKLDY